MEKAVEMVDAVVIGAGVVGLAVARALAMSGLETLLLERAERIGSGVSSRSSEVIHAGLYYPPGSLKARVCVQGRDMLYDYCESHQVAFRRCGKLVVATDAAQVSGLQALADRARRNGVHDLRWLDGTQAQALEPALTCVAALASPSTGIIDSHGLMLALLGDFEAAGGALALCSTVTRLRRDEQVWRLLVQAGGAEMALHAGVVVNAAGLWAPGLTQCTEGLPLEQQARAHFSKGSYFALAGPAPFSRLIYPLPQDAWLGVHLSLDLGGQARFGPDAEWLHGISDPQQLDYRVEAGRAEAFYADVRRYWPALPDGALQPAYSGVRPKIHGPQTPAPDFRIDGPSQHGQPGLVNLLGIESPGLTSCLSIAQQVLVSLELAQASSVSQTPSRSS
ncbi:NAD(P)/FAD-dependent oxidoreductase [Paucibacter sp. B2R-40]|uniref:NAD(P)/FAD-dependent oxidoreductase n=1 Tax=Paucibacter sp. B2R-40 TaxID=2893554 RepID=UPI0021E3BA32|nr:NAD(P)/FAD-dependent oxidoreductase [Paucibacter sp. B2R-40]MCV2353978.1 NAD(P)/FAD-dependent oxidoreductase [Paucibacter sp. B2R-40]